VSPAAFTHKAGFHVPLAENPSTYQHAEPADYGNRSRIVISDQSGRHSIIGKLEEMGICADDALARKILGKVKILAYQGYRFEGADASFYLLAKRESLDYEPPFKLNIKENGHSDDQDAYEVSVLINQAELDRSDTGPDEDWYSHPLAPTIGGIPGMFEALRTTLVAHYPDLKNVQYVNSRIQAENGTVRRVFLELTDGANQWTTVAADKHTTVAAWLAIGDAIEYALLNATEHIDKI
jgi:2-isopropylmalate synthase